MSKISVFTVEYVKKNDNTEWKAKVLGMNSDDAVNFIVKSMKGPIGVTGVTFVCKIDAVTDAVLERIHARLNPKKEKEVEPKQPIKTPLRKEGN